MQVNSTPAGFVVEAKIDHLPEELVVSIDRSSNETAYNCFLDDRKLAVLYKDPYGIWIQRWGRLDAYSLSSLSAALEAH
ncbi:hypothetical protein C7T94_09315 [Pedobacter yulinensis]|uniref:Uncharacterized protein n=1 Tax=Pedobacter yulinensis TaxID=2126353 RepID=A0A2T3HK83_9SPHI|nr:hypothetical protein [Pedobacter yulinensis]PST82829.1 hypothetical protein C7T94_09315 [Pedobacter yulinensis]